jgi:hypothetical protein
MFLENHVETEKEMKGSQRIMFVELPADIIDDKAGKFQSGLEISRGTFQPLFSENLFGQFSYLDRETFNKAENLVLYLKQRALQDYRYLGRIREFN